MTRDEFRTYTFRKTHNKCVVPGCIKKAADAHHIMERALWGPSDPSPEGYHEENGASLCEEHHKHAELGFFPPQALRRWLWIARILPAQLDPAKLYDKWGNEIEAANTAKYPRTPYLDFSPSLDVDDPILETAALVGIPLAITVKMDGSSVLLTRDRVAARNGKHADRPEFAPLKAFHAGLNLPSETIVYGEWLFARHTVAYEGPLALPHPLLVFGVYDEEDQLFLGREEVVSFCQEHGLSAVPTICEKITFQKDWVLRQTVTQAAERAIAQGHEGVVVKSVYPFHYSQHGLNAAKYVREGFVPGESFGGPLIKNQIVK